MQLHHKASLGALTLLLMGVALAQASEAPEPFVHVTHEAQGVSCIDCHDYRNQPENPTLITAICIECHDATPTWTLPKRARPLSVPFRHATHVAANGCEACHNSAGLDEHDPEAPLVDQAYCTRCHEQRDAVVPERRCVSCHGKDQRLEEPVNHDNAWARTHGPESEWSVVAEHGGGCVDCHQRSECRSCHMESRPADHNAFWRNRGHGAAANWDRHRCKTCHESGSCDGCHQTTQPMSHRGSWEASHGLVAGSQSDASCRVCHDDSWCRSCHMR